MTPDSSIPPTPIAKTSSRPKGKASSKGFLLERPGTSPSSWDRWYCETDGTPRPVGHEEPIPPSSKRTLLLPAGRLFSWPLWISRDGDPLELIRLELAGRHLLQRGMESSLIVLPLESEGERRLVTVIAPIEPFPADALPENWQNAETIGLSPLALSGSADLVVWMEWGELHAAFFRQGLPVWFCQAGAESLPGVIYRSALRLQAENVITSLPGSILLAGMSEGMMRRVQISLSPLFSHSSIRTLGEVLPPPAEVVWSNKSIDLPPAAARSQRVRRNKQEKLLNLAAMAAVLYALLLLWGSGDLLIRRMALKRLRTECASLQEPAAKSHAAADRWKSLRHAVDPSLFALDLLAAAATPTDGGKIRLTRFSLEQGRLQISAEATDVTQAYSFIDRIKKSPRLDVYEWNAGQPQLAGKSSVRFDMEGIRHDEKPGS